MKCGGLCFVLFFFFSSRRRHTRLVSDWSSDGVLFRSRQTHEIERREHEHEQARGGRVDARGPRSEERRVGKECRSRWSPHDEKKKLKQSGVVKRIGVTSRERVGR